MNQHEKEYGFISFFKQMRIIKKVKEEFLLGFVFLFHTGMKEEWWNPPVVCLFS